MLFAPVFLLDEERFECGCGTCRYDFEVEAAVWTGNDLSFESIVCYSDGCVTVGTLFVWQILTSLR